MSEDQNSPPDLGVRADLKPLIGDKVLRHVARHNGNRDARNATSNNYVCEINGKKR